MKIIRLLAFVAILLISGNALHAGVIRHFVKPVAKTSARVTAKVVKTGAHVVKTVVY